MQLRMAHAKIRNVATAAIFEAFRLARREGTTPFSRDALPIAPTKNPGDEIMAGGAETMERDAEQMDPLAEEQSEPLDEDRAMVVF